MGAIIVGETLKILFTADIHLKLGQKNVPVDWARNRYTTFFEQVRNIETGVDLHIIGGDIFDRLPSMDELALYFEFIQRIRVSTLIYAGNHEATKKGKTFFSALKEVTNTINPLVEIVDSIYEHDLFTIVPYEFIHKKGVWDSLPIKPVFTHVRGAIEPHVIPEIDLSLLTKFPVVYAGDLHSHSNTQLNIVYPGSPMTVGFHRNHTDTGYLIIQGNDLTNWSWHKFELPQLIRKTVSRPEDMISTNYDHTIYELEGSTASLNTVGSSDLLDKKLVKRSSDTSLILKPTMTLQEELVEYWTYILELSEDEIQRGLKTFNDYFKEA